MPTAPHPRPPGSPAPSEARAGGYRRTLLVIALIVVAAYELVLVLGPSGSRAVTAVSDLGTLLGALAFVVACLLAARRSSGQTRSFWRLLGASGLLWAVAEAVWAVYEVVLDRSVPTPSWADVGYLSAPVVAGAALLLHPAAHRSGVRRGRAALDGFSLATAVIFLGWVFVLGPVWHTSDLSTGGGVVTVAYPFTDLVLVTLAVLTLLRASGRDRYAIGGVLTGLAVLAGSDGAYTYLTQVGDYRTGGWIDGGWLLGYLCVAAGAVLAPASREAHTADEPSTDEPSTEFAVIATVAPFVPVLLALGAAGLRPDAVERLDGPARLMALALVLMVLVRQVLLWLDRDAGVVPTGATGATT